MITNYFSEQLEEKYLRPGSISGGGRIEETAHRPVLQRAEVEPGEVTAPDSLIVEPKSSSRVVWVGEETKFTRRHAGARQRFEI